MITQHLNVDCNRITGTPVPGGWGLGAVAPPTFLLIVHDIKMVTIHKIKFDIFYLC